MTGSDEKTQLVIVGYPSFSDVIFFHARCSPRESARKQKDKEKDKKKAQEKKVSVWPDVVFISLDNSQLMGNSKKCIKRHLRAKVEITFHPRLGYVTFSDGRIYIWPVYTGVYMICVLASG